jgi:integrase
MYFSLKDNNANKDTLIIIRYYISKSEGRFVYSTGLNVSPKDWDKQNKIGKLAKGRSDLSAINRSLQKYSTFLEKTLSYLEINEIEVTREVLKNKFQQEFNSNNTSNNIQFKNLTDFVTDFIKKAPELTNRNTKKKYTATMLQHYKKVNNRLLEFEKHRGTKLILTKFTISVYDEFLDYLNTQGYSKNTIGNFVKHIKIFLKKAEEFKYNVHADYKENNFSVLKEDSVSIALNENEIDLLFNHNFSYNNRLQNCRDIAIIGLWTGLRVSDFLTLAEIKEEQDFITVQPQKTKNSSGVKVVIPLHHHIKEIIKNRGMPRMISDVKFNKYFKEVCEAIALNNLVKGSLMVKDEVKGVYRKKLGMYPKHKLVSSHTCRRSFATNLYKMNFPTLSIMSITGHTTEKSFLTYIKVTPTEHAEKLLNHWKEYYKTK